MPPSFRQVPDPVFVEHLKVYPLQESLDLLLGRTEGQPLHGHASTVLLHTIVDIEVTNPAYFKVAELAAWAVETERERDALRAASDAAADRQRAMEITTAQLQTQPHPWREQAIAWLRRHEHDDAILGTVYCDCGGLHGVLEPVVTVDALVATLQGEISEVSQ